MSKPKVILDLCGGTGSWSRPYHESDRYKVIVVDPLAEGPTAFPGTVAEFYRVYRELPYPVHGVLAAPPCDHFSVSGAQYWPEKDADGRTKAALDIVDVCLDVIEFVDPVWWALENPVGRLRRLRQARLGDVTYSFHPCHHGDPYTKKTLVWGNFTIPETSPVEPVRSCKQGSWLQKLGGKSAKTKRLRSATPPGFARAFAEANR